MIRAILALGTLLLLASCQRSAASACTPIAFEGSRFTVCRATPASHELALVDRGVDRRPMRDFAGLEARLGTRFADLAFAMNAGMFDDAGLPIGLYVENGTERHGLNRAAGTGNFHLEPNGVFWEDAQGWHVATTPAFAAARARPRFATQSGPMLVIGGALHPKIAANGTSLHIRNAVGIARDGSAQFVISDQAVSFGRLARLFRDRLDCPDALYLDGAVSRLWDPATRRRDGGPPIGPIVVALRKR